MHIFCRLSVYIVEIMFLNELYYNKFYHLLVYFLTCCALGAQISIISFRVLRDSPEASSYRRRRRREEVLYTC